MYRAYGNRVLAEVQEDALSKAGIVLPEDVSVNPIAQATIVSVGPGVMTTHGWDSPQVKVGEQIIFYRVKGLPVPEIGESIVTIWAGDILAVERDGELSRPHLANLVESGAAG